MQQLQHKQFTALPTGRQVWNEQSSLPIRYSYVLSGTGFTAPDSYRDGKMSNDDTIRPWFER